MRVLFVNANDGFIHKASANAALYPNVGLLTLMAALKDLLKAENCPCTLDYIDGCVYGNSPIEEYISRHAPELLAICFSTLTSNYGASVELSEFAKSKNPRTTTIYGNDHFSALHDRIIRKRNYGFYGNDVVFGFANFVRDLALEKPLSLGAYQGLVYRGAADQVCRNAENPTEYNKLPLVDYGLCDATLPHTERYIRGQRETYYFMKDRGLRSQIVDIGRGCIKFSGKRINDIPVNACDFVASYRAPELSFQQLHKWRGKG